MRIGLFAVIMIFLACGCGGKNPEESAQGNCADGEDNDFDGKYDCDDDGCESDDYCLELARKISEGEKEKQRALSEAAKIKSQEEKQPESGPWFDLEGLLVQTGTNGKEINWYGAEEYCKGLALDGKSGWRLPTSEEALKIVSSGRFEKDPSSYVMWTSTKEGKDMALIVGITGGAVNPLPMKFDGECRARCVLGLEK